MLCVTGRKEVVPSVVVAMVSAACFDYRVRSQVCCLVLVWGTTSHQVHGKALVMNILFFL